LVTLSLHVDAWQRPAVQTPLAQSEANAQLFPSEQGEQVPPQSTSVSFPSLALSVHVGWAQTPPVQVLLVQSAPLAHFFPSSQREQVPPQSTSVSLPSCFPSAQGPTMSPPVPLPDALLPVLVAPLPPLPPALPGSLPQPEVRGNAVPSARRKPKERVFMVSPFSRPQRRGDSAM
jgi:hypothetical protein